MAIKNKISEIHEFKDEDFWTHAKNRLILDSLPKKKMNILDIGCGAGFLAKKLAKLDHRVDAVDVLDESIEFTKERVPKNKSVKVWKSSIEDMKESNRYDCVITSDVLEHIEDDIRAIHKISRLLNPDGFLIVTVPALKYLFGQHDICCEHRRRYSKRELESKLQKYFEIETIRYWNITMLPVEFVVSKVLKRSLSRRKLRHGFFGKALNNILKIYYLNIENKISMPIGITLFAVCKNKNHIPPYQKENSFH